MVGGGIGIGAGLCAAGLYAYAFIFGCPPPSEKTIGLSRQKQLATGLQIYATDFDDLMTPAATWGTGVTGYVSRSGSKFCFDDPFLKRKGSFGYAFFAPVGGMKADSLVDPDKVPLVIQTDMAGLNANGDLTALPAVPRVDKRADIIAYFDSSTKVVPRPAVATPVVIRLKP